MGHSADTTASPSKLSDAVVRALPRARKGRSNRGPHRGKGVRRPHHSGLGESLHPELPHPRRAESGARPDRRLSRLEGFRGTGGSGRAQENHRPRWRPLGEIPGGTRVAPTVADLSDGVSRLTTCRASASRRRRPTANRSWPKIRPALGRLKVSEVSLTKLMVARGISKRAPYRANRVVALLSRMFSMALRWGWRADNPQRRGTKPGT